MADGSVTASEPTPIAASVEQVSSASESEALRTTTSKLKEISMNELRILSRKVYPNVGPVMKVPVMQKIRDVLCQESGSGEISIRYH